MDLTKLLICKIDTTLIDLKSFIQTALRDAKNQYVIIRPERLDNKSQQYVIDTVKSFQSDE